MFSLAKAVVAGSFPPSSVRAVASGPSGFLTSISSSPDRAVKSCSDVSTLVACSSASNCCCFVDSQFFEETDKAAACIWLIEKMRYSDMLRRFLLNINLTE